MRLIFVCLLFALFFSFSACLRMRMSDRKIQKEFHRAYYIPKQHQYLTDEGRTMNYVEAGSDEGPVVFMIHGSPGSWIAFKDFFKDSVLLSKIKLVAVDRPGFGFSGYGIPEPSLKKQAEAILPLLKHYGSQHPIILVGHSLGGALIARIAMDYPRYISSLIFVAASVDPALEPKSWYRAPMHFLRRILPGSIRSSNEEILSMKEELNQMLPLWSTVHQPCVVIQGEEDNLVPPANANFLEKHLTGAEVELIRIPEMNHFIPWKAPQYIKKAILKESKAE